MCPIHFWSLMVFLLPPNSIIPKHTGEVLVTFQTNLNKQQNLPVFNLCVIHGDKITIAQHRTSLITLTDEKKRRVLHDSWPTWVSEVWFPCELLI